MTSSPNLDRLETIAIALQDLKEEAVFVGGAVCELYIEDPAAPPFRPTDDVDCVIEIRTRGKYYELEEKLRALGFAHDKDGPLCRKIYKGIKVDFLPSEPQVIGLPGKWFREGMKHLLELELPDQTRIKILELPYFTATKFEAFFERGKGDFYASHDFEDIVNVLAYRKSYEDFDGLPGALKKDLSACSQTVVRRTGILEIIRGHLEAREPAEIAERVLSVFKKLSG
jgi:predicted nucleotidyltransferase